VINYLDSVDKISSRQLIGFFVGWPNPPLPQKHLKILKSSYKCFLALDGDKVVGFINAISDGILSAYIPLLEVLPEYQNRGIGMKLMELMLEELSSFYMIDLVCDEDMISFYQKCGLRKFSAMGIRNYSRQSAE